MTFIVILHGVCTKSWICGLLSFVTLTIFLAGILWILFLSNYCLSFWDYSYMYVGSLHSFHLLPPACIRLDIFHWPIFQVHLWCLSCPYPGIPNYWVLNFGFCIFSPKIYTYSSSHNVFINFLGYINRRNVPIWWLYYLGHPRTSFCGLIFDHLILFMYNTW